MEPDSSLDLSIEDLPGIGRRYEMTGTNGGRIIVIITHSGRRIVHGLSPGVDQASAVELTDRQARKLGAILGGAFFKPAVVEELEAVFGNLLIDWVTLEEASPGAGKTIGELPTRRRTGGTVVAIVRTTRRSRFPSRQRRCGPATAWSSSAATRTAARSTSWWSTEPCTLPTPAEPELPAQPADVVPCQG